MATFTVSLTMPISTTVDVEADDVEQARELATENAPDALNSSNDADEAGEWEATAVYADGEQVWESSTVTVDATELAELRALADAAVAWRDGPHPSGWDADNALMLAVDAYRTTLGGA